MQKHSLLSFLLLIVLTFAACSAPAERVGIGEVCQKPKNAWVEAEGYLVLPNHMTTTTTFGRRSNKKTYQLFLISQPDAKGDSVRAIAIGTSTGERNHIRDLPPNGYTFKDLQIFPNQGAPVGANQRLKITGQVKPISDGKCDVEISKIETP